MKEKRREKERERAALLWIINRLWALYLCPCLWLRARRWRPFSLAMPSRWWMSRRTCIYTAVRSKRRRGRVMVWPTCIYHENRLFFLSFFKEIFLFYPYSSALVVSKMMLFPRDRAALLQAKASRRAASEVSRINTCVIARLISAGWWPRGFLACVYMINKFHEAECWWLPQRVSLGRSTVLQSSLLDILYMLYKTRTHVYILCATQRCIAYRIHIGLYRLRWRHSRMSMSLFVYLYCYVY